MRNIWNDATDGIGVILMYILKWTLLACGILTVIALLIALFQILFS